ncbi:hypothetical protein CPB84DRAFT_1875694 [Gymnopilus junonius]|uniref:Uncharacterized protein n=1 Tax=Gymnopilus junonius TaxID=109634 RepID=A0A9P5NW04_GYMJU|nr:hypothetical protein CPB84DRAFT_1875694 [Gymnopilus junonius]
MLFTEAQQGITKVFKSIKQWSTNHTSRDEPPAGFGTAWIGMLTMRGRSCGPNEWENLPNATSLIESKDQRRQHQEERGEDEQYMYSEGLVIKECQRKNQRENNGTADEHQPMTQVVLQLGSTSDFEVFKASVVSKEEVIARSDKGSDSLIKSNDPLGFGIVDGTEVPGDEVAILMELAFTMLNGGRFWTFFEADEELVNLTSYGPRDSETSYDGAVALMAEKMALRLTGWPHKMLSHSESGKSGTLWSENGLSDEFIGIPWELIFSKTLLFVGLSLSQDVDLPQQFLLLILQLGLPVPPYVLCNYPGLWLLVMCRLRLGLKAPALAWLELALAFPNLEPGQKPKIRLGLARLWPKPGLLPYTKKYCVKVI